MTTTIMIRENVTLDFNDITLTGAIAYQPTTGLMTLISEEGDEDDLTVDLTAYGYLPEPGEAFVPDYSEHTGLPKALKDAGVAEVLETITFGPFTTTAARMALSL